MSRQLALNVQLRDEATFENFMPGGNAALVNQLKLGLQGQGDRVFYLWGEHGVGRSHLLQACCHYASSCATRSVFIPLVNKKQFSVEIVDHLENLSLICIDDIHFITRDIAWEEAIFHLYNRISLTKSLVVISGNQAPRHLQLSLADLRSRLAWGLVFQVHELSEQDKMKALSLHAKARGLILALPVANFLLRRCSRNMHDLVCLLEQLDRASLIHQRNLTIPFIKSVLNL